MSMKYNSGHSNLLEQINIHQKQIDMLTKRFRIGKFTDAILMHKDGKGNMIEWYVNYVSTTKNNDKFLHITERTDDVFNAKTLSLFIDQSNGINLEDAIKNNFEWKK